MSSAKKTPKVPVSSGPRPITIVLWAVVIVLIIVAGFLLLKPAPQTTPAQNASGTAANSDLVGSGASDVNAADPNVAAALKSDYLAPKNGVPVMVEFRTPT